MNTIDLDRFCNPDREIIARPFSVGEWTYATNGWILVRVPRREDVAENPAAPDIEHTRLIEYLRKPRYKPAPKFELQEPFEREDQFECFYCVGSGHEHRERCSSCTCICPRCDGTGKLATPNFRRTSIGKALYNSKYISWMQSLPQLELGQPHKRNPLAFRFDGGEGC
jgi:hypothetical protein